MTENEEIKKMLADMLIIGRLEGLTRTLNMGTAAKDILLEAIRRLRELSQCA